MRELVSVGCLSEIYWFIDRYNVYYVKCKYNNDLIDLCALSDIITRRHLIACPSLKVQGQIFYKYSGRVQIKESRMY